MSPPTLLISAGEPSGDRHAARFLDEFRRRHPGTQAFGLGGPELRAAGLEPLARMEDLAVVGLVEAISRLPQAFRALALLEREAARRRPDLVVPVDFPDFNLRLASRARRLGLKVLYYVSPQVWAWRESRVARIGRDVDRLAVVFPFEVEYYRKRGLTVDYVGHPLLEEMGPPPATGAFHARHGLDPARPLVALFPGSRVGEVVRHWPLLLEAARLLAVRRPGTQAVAALAAGLPGSALAVPARSAVKVVAGEEHDLLRSAGAAAVAAGTATLEALLAGCPQVVYYRTSPLTYALMKRAVKLRHVSLANIVGGGDVACELLQSQATPAGIAAELERLLDDPAEPARVRARATKVVGDLGGPRASEELSRVAEGMLWPVP
ncbi:MAG: lipid-A-disaccharide synthase [Candidatus Eisenbacteria bacterium]|nr:lipid-A-disaccharide synthase [Candidatus Eisenbacteria bacterium]